MEQYHKLILDTLTNPKSVIKKDRTGSGTLGSFGYQMRFNLTEDFPIITTKKIHLKSVIHELLWFLKGDSNIKYLQENDVRIWNEWADANGELGPVYGVQWRSWPTANGKSIDQITQVLNNLKTNPDSRRHIVSSWNVGEIDTMALPPCHAFFQFYVGNGKLSTQLYQRSGDIFLGVPFNIASYVLLNMMIAQVLGYENGDFVHTLGDRHIYLGGPKRTEFYQLHQKEIASDLQKITNRLEYKDYANDLSRLVSAYAKDGDNRADHVPLAIKQLSREHRPGTKMLLNKKDSLFDYTYDDFELQNYDPHPGIKGDVAV